MNKLFTALAILSVSASSFAADVPEADYAQTKWFAKSTTVISASQHNASSQVSAEGGAHVFESLNSDGNFTRQVSGFKSHVGEDALVEQRATFKVDLVTEEELALNNTVMKDDITAATTVANDASDAAVEALVATETNTAGVAANAEGLVGEAHARRLMDDHLRSRIANAQADRMVGDELLQEQVTVNKDKLSRVNMKVISNKAEIDVILDDNKAQQVQIDDTAAVAATNAATNVKQQTEIDANASTNAKQQVTIDSAVSRMTVAEKEIYSTTLVSQHNRNTNIRQDAQIGALQADMSQVKADISNLYGVTETLGYRIDGANASMHALHNSSVRLMYEGDYSVGAGVGFAGSEQAVAISGGYAVSQDITVQASVHVTTGHVNDVAAGAGATYTFK